MDKEIAISILVLLVIVATTVGVILTGDNVHGHYRCDNYERITGTPTQWASFDACYIKTARGWERM